MSEAVSPPMTSRQDEAVALLPCPFCGSPAELERDSDHHGSWFNLGCSRHWYRVGPEKACIAGRIFYTESERSEADAIAIWNTRPSASPAGREEVARIIDPWAWQQCEWASRDGNDAVLREYLPKREESLAKADRILSLAAPEREGEPNLFWDKSSPEAGYDTIADLLDHYSPGEVVEVQCARSLPDRFAVSWWTGGDDSELAYGLFATPEEALAASLPEPPSPSPEQPK